MAENYVLTLPASSHDLSEFILKLLGRGRTIRKEIRRPFAIDIQGLRNLHHSIEQRITRQSPARISAFEIEVTFVDGHSYSMATVDEFLNHNFQQNVACATVRMGWIYLVTFSGRQPEKQQIDVFLCAQPIMNESFRSGAVIEFAIEHTEVTWGYDIFRHIEHFLDAHVMSEEDPLARLWRFLNRFDVPIFSIAMFVGMLASFHLVDNLVHGALAIDPALGELARLENKVDALLKRQRPPIPQMFFVMAISMSLMVSSYYFLKRVLRAFDKSAIILNENMKVALDFERHRHFKSRCIAALLVIISLGLGVFQNLLYDLSGLKKLFGVG